MDKHLLIKYVKSANIHAKVVLGKLACVAHVIQIHLLFCIKTSVSQAVRKSTIKRSLHQNAYRASHPARNAVHKIRVFHVFRGLTITLTVHNASPHALKG